MTRLPLILGIALALNACGYTDTGSGSGTLQVNALISYAAGDNDTTSVEITVLDNSGSPLSGAAVELTDDKTGDTFAAAEQDVADAPGVYTASINQYRRRLELTISKDSHSLDGKLEGPGEHTIEFPAFAQSVVRSDFGESMEVTWATTDGLMADRVTLSLDDNRFMNTLQEDVGAGLITAKNLNSGAEGVTVARRNRMVFAKGLNDSTFEIAYSVRHTIQVQE